MKTNTVLLWLSVEQGTMKVWWPGFNIQLVLLSRPTGFVSSGNLSAFDVIGSKVQKTAGNNIVTIKKRNVACGKTIIVCPQLHHQSSVKPYSTDNGSKFASVLHFPPDH